MKIDKTGTYLPFAGVTIIATVSQQDSEFWQGIHNLLNQPIIRKYYTPLPNSSYHMTTNNLCVAKGKPNWIEFIEKNLSYFQALSETLKQHPHEIITSFTGITKQGAIQLNMLFNDPNQEQIIRSVATQHKCARGIPRIFHITLAYQYSTIEDDDIPAILTVLKTIENKLLEKPKPIELNPPALHIFQDMTQYTPWDGTTNPFIKEHLADENSVSSFSFCRLS